MTAEQIMAAVDKPSQSEPERVFDHVLAVQAERRGQHLTAEESEQLTRINIGPGNVNNPRLNRHLLWVGIGFVAAVSLLILISVFHPYLTERAKFATVNILSVCVLAAIIAQALINRSQWEAMRNQERLLEKQAKAFDAQVTAMQDQLGVMRTQAREEQSAFARQSSEDASRAAELRDRADILVSDVRLSISAALRFSTYAQQHAAGKITQTTALTVELKNKGRTRAERLAFICKLNAYSDRQLPVWPVTMSPEILAAGDTIEAQFGPLGPWLDQQMIDRINEGHGFLQTVVEIYYKDAFGHDHSTEGRGFFRPQTYSFDVSNSEFADAGFFEDVEKEIHVLREMWNRRMSQEQSE
jgi:hypothetical protein